MAEMMPAFQGRHPGAVVRLNLGASGELARQIEAGAPVDVFLSAGAGPVDALQRRGLLDPASRVAFAANTLVVVTPAAGALPLVRPADLASAAVRRLALGRPSTVPAGQYAEQSLRRLGLWELLRPRVVFAENVRQVLDYVARGEVEAGVVYATDARARAAQIRVALVLSPETHAPIVYSAAVLREARHPALGRAWLALLAAPDGRAVLGRHGFAPPPTP